MKESGRRRGFKSWFVEPYLQVKLGLIFLMLNVVFATLTLGIFGYYIWDISQTLAVYFKLTDEQSAQILTKFATPMTVACLLITAFVVTSILVAVRYTHQIYGPLVSIHRFLDECMMGERVQPLVLRESDQLKSLAEKLNDVMLTAPDEIRMSNMRSIMRYIDLLLDGGSPEPLTLREGDQFHGLAERLNRLGQRLRVNRVG